MGRDARGWTIEYEGHDFERFFSKLGGYEQAVLAAAINQVLKVHGIDICQASGASLSATDSTSSACVGRCGRSSQQPEWRRRRVWQVLTGWF